MGPALVLALATLTLLGAGVTVLALIWRGASAREDAFFGESRQMDATVQQSPGNLVGPAPEWLRVNLRDGRVLLAVAFAGPERQGYRVGFVAAGSPPVLPDEPPVWIVERAGLDDGLSEAVAIFDGQRNRVGAYLPLEGERGLGGPLVWEGRFQATPPYRTARGEITREGQVVALLFPGPYGRLGLMQWQGAAAEKGEVREQAALLALLARWTLRLRLGGVLRRQP